jgi:TetR/AcrR family transcriptional regulator
LLSSKQGLSRRSEISPKDGQPSREAVLAAAEDLFARKGYGATSLQEIGDAAGVSRGLPSYFFGSKEALYAAVVNRVFARAGKALRLASERAAQHEPADAIGELIAGCLDFLAADPNFVHVVQREALRGGDPVRDALRGPVLDQALVGVKAIAKPLHVDPAHLLVLLASVCWFPYAHANTLPQALGLDPYATEFREQHRRAIVELMLAHTPDKRREAPSGG